MDGQRQVQQKRPGLNLQKTTTRQLKQIWDEIFLTHRVIAFDRYNFICRKQRKIETLEQFHADLVELVSLEECGDKENEWLQDMFNAHVNNEKIAKDLLAELPRNCQGIAKELLDKNTTRNILIRNKTREGHRTQQNYEVKSNRNKLVSCDQAGTNGLHSTKRRSSRIFLIFFWTIIEENTRMEDKIKTQEEIKTEVHKLYFTKTVLQMWENF